MMGYLLILAVVLAAAPPQVKQSAAAPLDGTARSQTPLPTTIVQTNPASGAGSASSARPVTTTIAVSLVAPSTAASPLDTVEKILKIAAYFIGGAWVYFNYFRGRTYHARLEPHVKVELCRRSTPEFMKSVATLKNVGLSRVPLRA